MATTRKKRNRDAPSPELFSVLDPFTRDFFIADADTAFEHSLRSPRSGRLLPTEGRVVQWLPRASYSVMPEAKARKISAKLKTLKKQVVAEARKAAVPLDIETRVEERRRELSRLFAKQKGVPPALIQDALTAAAQSTVRAFEDTYYDLHTVSFDVVGNEVLVFNVGRNPRILYAVPILAAITAKEIAIIIAIIIELIKLIGRWFGVRVSEQNCADVIAKWLENNKVLKAILAFIEKVKGGVGDMLSALSDMFVALYEEGALTEILTAAFASAFGVLGIIWLILTLLSWLIPGAGPAVRILELLAAIAALGVKVASL